MGSIKILIPDPVDEVCATKLRSNGFQVDQIKLNKDELLQKIKEYSGMIVRSETKVTADVLEAGTNLKIVGRAGTGVDNVDCPTATKKGVLVMNTPGGNTLSAAEHTCHLISSLSRHVPQACASLKNGAWDRKKYMGHELLGKTLAIIGLGRIGKEVAIRMQSYGMTTIGFDPIIPGEVSREFGVEWMELEQIWPKADYITVHTPLIPQTKNLINDEVFKKCKKGVKVINVARGGIIEEESIIRNLKNGLCGGAGLDVFCEEPPKSEYYKELFSHPLVVCTPHLGASTTEAQLRVAEEMADQFVDFFNGKSLVGAVNAFSLAAAMNGPNKPWLTLGQALGTLVSVFGQSSSLTVSVEGPSLGDVGFLSSAVAAGFLSGLTSDPSINMINASAMAKEKGIILVINQKESTEKILSVIANDNSRDVTVKGSLHGDVALLHNINEASFSGSLPLRGPLVFFSGNDPKGYAQVESILEKKNAGETKAIFKSFGGETTYFVAAVKNAASVQESFESEGSVKFIAGRNFH